MDICMNLIALQSYPLNKFEQTTPNKLTPNEYTRQERVILEGGVCYLNIWFLANKHPVQSITPKALWEQITDPWAIDRTP